MRTFSYNKISKEEQTKRGILGRLTGIIADWANPTRNGRRYGKELWTNVFNNDIFKEKLSNHLICGELGHPEDRIEVNLEKVAISLSEMPQINDDGFIYGVFDILDTPAGRVLKTLCDYGCNIGVSSRGQGDVIGDDVDADTYSCECWDAVLLPAVKEARMKYVTESFNTTSLTESLEHIKRDADESDRQTLTDVIEGLDNLDSYVSSVVEEDNNLPIKEVTKNEESADNIEDSVVEELQRALVQNKELTERIIDLQEKLSVCNAKETQLNERILNINDAVNNLTHRLSQDKAYQTKSSEVIDKLKTQLEAYRTLSTNKTRDVQHLEREVGSLKEQLKKLEANSSSVSSTLKEQLSINKVLTEKNNKLVESFRKLEELRKSDTNEYKTEKTKLIEDCDSKVSKLTEDYDSKLTEVNSELQKSKSLLEKYKNIANNAVNKLIENKSQMIGCSVKDITTKLPNKYTFDDIDRVCESIQTTRVAINKLPFALGSSDKTKKVSNIGVKRNQSTPFYNADDVVDDDLMNIINK